MKQRKSRPDYAKLYPGIEISAKVMGVLKMGDRKAEYQEYDIKKETWKIDQSTQTAICIPSREDSLDRLLENDQQFVQDGDSVDDIVVQKILLEKLPSCLSLLTVEEQELIDAIFYKNIGERKYAAQLGISKTTLHARKVKILARLKFLLENKKFQ